MDLLLDLRDARARVAELERERAAIEAACHAPADQLAARRGRFVEVESRVADLEARRAALARELERVARVRVLCGNCGRTYLHCKACDMNAHLCDLPASDGLAHDPACALAFHSGAEFVERIQLEAVEAAVRETIKVYREPGIRVESPPRMIARIAAALRRGSEHGGSAR